MRTEQQWDVKVRFAFMNLERDFHDGVKPFDFLRVMVARRIEAQAVKAGAKRIAFGEQLGAAAIGVRAGRGEGDPIAGDFPALEAHSNAARGLALGGVENVGGDSFHAESHFFSRIWAICRCCSAASKSSVSSSLRKRRWRISKISEADFLVAQTMKMRPKRFSYSRLPSASAAFTCSFEALTFCCSVADQVADLADAEDGACDSPIRGWLVKASSQSASRRFFHTSSLAAKREASSGIGLRAAIPSAQALEPQHAKISCAASLGGRVFQRASNRLIPIVFSELAEFFRIQEQGADVRKAAASRRTPDDAASRS